MEEVIEQLRELNEPVPVPLELPDDARMDATITWSIWTGRSPCGMATMAS